ncbi:MAG TPA: polymer-forming cytoskeletal protein [Patescibacteria group bacterium]|jgi:cytoskeletal protein CcmA (bactofilin family)|nr:polymer-forming cytoskeletal protein [Patescibacteria group bacterium]
MKQMVLALVATLAIGGLMASSVSAQAVFKTDDATDTQVAKGEVVDGAAYLVGNNIRMSGTVRGDVYCAGSTITIDGTVEGDVLCAGATVTVNGTVQGNVRLAGATIVLGGTVGKSATVLGADVTTDRTLKLANDLTGAAGNLTVDGSIGRDLTAGAGTLTLRGTVGRDVASALGTAVIANEARVKGNFAYTSDTQTTVPTSVVAGKTTFTQSTQRDNAQRANYALDAVFVVLVTVGFGLMIMLGVILFPRQTHMAGAISWSSFGIASVIGLTFVVTAPLAAALLLITGVGMIISYVLILVWLLLIAVSAVPFAYFVGTKLYGSRSAQVLVRATVGALVVMLALLIPIVNVITVVVMVCTGVGMILRGVPGLYQHSPYHVREPQTKQKWAA